MSLLAALIADAAPDDIRKLMQALIGEAGPDELRELAEALRPLLTGECDDRFLTLVEKAARLGLHPDTLRRMAQEGRIRAVKVGREWRFREGDLPEHRRHTANDPAVDADEPRRRSSVTASVAAIRGL